MNRSDFEARFRCFGRRVAGILFGGVFPVIFAGILAMEWGCRHFGWPRLAASAAGFPLFCGVCCLGAWIVEKQHHRHGVHCPSCGHALALRHLMSDTSSTGRCPACHSQLFDPHSIS